MCEFYNDAETSVCVMCADVPSLASVSGCEHYGIFFLGDNLNFETIESRLKNAAPFYSIRGFNVVSVLGRSQIKALKDRNRAGSLINLVPRGEHVP